MLERLSYLSTFSQITRLVALTPEHRLFQMLGWCNKEPESDPKN